MGKSHKLSTSNRLDHGAFFSMFEHGQLGAIRMMMPASIVPAIAVGRCPVQHVGVRAEPSVWSDNEMTSRDFDWRSRVREERQVTELFHPFWLNLQLLS
jgi:hypothetical protein